jgi:hypothetical protein
MKTPDDNNLDRLFREGLTGSDGKAEFKEEDWDAMENLLNNEQGKKRGFIWLYWLSGSIAACFLLFFGWQLFSPTVLSSKKTEKVSVKKASGVDRNKDGKTKSHAKTDFNNDEKLAQKKDPALATTNFAGKRSTLNVYTKNLNSELASPKIADKRSMVSDTSSAAFTPELAATKKSVYKKGGHPLNQISGNGGETYTELKATEITTITADQTLASAIGIKFDTSFTGKKTVKTPEVFVKNKKAIKPGLTHKPAISLAILTAPDVNGVSSFAGGKIGTNAGLQISVSLSKKWSINAGAAYAVKPYAISSGNAYSSGYSSPSPITSVDANCKVLDIPVNVNYQLYSNQKNAFSIGSGLSSYLMLREHYEFYYANNTEWNYNIANQNKHILSVVNLNATYQRQVNSRLNLLIQPYYKVPLKGVGYERVNLQSAGVALGVGWKLGSFKIK